jgi:SPP1 gp7 family putative phage head morphogenesis protein
VRRARSIGVWIVEGSLTMGVFEDMVDQSARHVARLSDAELTELLPVLQAARDEEARIFAKFLAETGGDETFTRAIHRQLLAKLNAAIRAAQKRVYGAVSLDLRTGLVSAGTRSLTDLAKTVDAGIKKFGSGKPLALDKAATMASARRWLASRYEKSAERYAGRYGALVRSKLAVCSVRGLSIDQTAKQLLQVTEKYLAHMTPVQRAKAIAQRQFLSSQSDAERLVHTENAYAANLMTVTALADPKQGGGGEWMKRWNAAFDKRTCKDCSKLHGETVPAGALFSCGLMCPPLHPRCRCSTTPHHRSWGS